MEKGGKRVLLLLQGELRMRSAKQDQHSSLDWLSKFAPLASFQLRPETFGPLGAGRNFKRKAARS